jgi:hypothetical protein
MKAAGIPDVMPPHFDLIITADHPNRTAEFRLLDSTGGQLAYRQTDFKTIPASRRQGLFDLRNYLRLYVEEERQSAAAAEIGVCIAEEVLGREIFETLWKSESQRTLRIQLPGASQEENYLAAALARVPWEIAGPTPISRCWASGTCWSVPRHAGPSLATDGTSARRAAARAVRVCRGARLAPAGSQAGAAGPAAALRAGNLSKAPDRGPLP